MDGCELEAQVVLPGSEFRNLIGGLLLAELLVLDKLSSEEHGIFFGVEDDAVDTEGKAGVAGVLSGGVKQVETFFCS